MEKIHILDALGEQAVMLPGMVNAALAANDRIKFDFALLQLAQGRAEHPAAAVPDLTAERNAAGVPADGREHIVVEALALDKERYRLPGAQPLCARIAADLATMLAPVSAAGMPEAAAFAKRLDALRDEPWCDADEVMTRAQIDALVAGTRAKGRKRDDTAHLLVMDLHKALNRLQKNLAAERIEGAAVYGLADTDRELVAAFMRGVAHTRALKFDHPGLGTTATRSGARLILQNDIGTTEAHVLVVHVEDRAVDVTYTDVHMARLMFFQALFEQWAVQWEDTRSKTDSATAEGIYHLSVGRFVAKDGEELRGYLEFLGSRLVFLIDWNRARKRLRPLLGRKDALALLKWAADAEVGHMGFLRTGADEAVCDALRFAAQNVPLFGTRLDALLGRKAAVEYLRFFFRTATEGLLAGREADYVRDALRAELLGHLHTAQQNLLDMAAEHAALSLELANGVRDTLLQPDDETRAAALARRAVEWEHRADMLIVQARGVSHHSERSAFFVSLLAMADDIADELEDAIFHLSLLPRPLNQPMPQALATLSTLAGLAVEGCQEYVKALEAVRVLYRARTPEDLQDFLGAIHRIVAAEHASDNAYREFERALMTSGMPEPGMLFAALECARNLEAAVDALMHAALSLRDEVLGEARGA
jgi:uncharacterized protein Yka (UPF0111/DUF47 family)